MERHYWELSIFDPRSIDPTIRVNQPDAGAWSVVMINTSAPHVNNPPIAWVGMSEQSARKKLRELIRYCASYDGQYRRVGSRAYAWIADIYAWAIPDEPLVWEGHHIIAMTDQQPSANWRILKPNQLPI